MTLFDCLTAEGNFLFLVRSALYGAVGSAEVSDFGVAVRPFRTYTVWIVKLGRPLRLRLHKPVPTKKLE